MWPNGKVEAKGQATTYGDATDVPLRAVFERPTIGGLAAMLDGTRSSVAETAEPPLVALPRSAYRVALSPDGTLSTQ